MIYSDFKDNLNAFLKSYGLYMAIGVAVIILLAILLIVLMSRRNKGPKIQKQNIKIDSSIWQVALGGKDNILEINATGSRLSLKLNDPSQIDEGKLKELGVTNILKMSNKITLVVEDQAEAILKQIQ